MKSGYSGEIKIVEDAEGKLVWGVLTAEIAIRQDVRSEKDLRIHRNTSPESGKNSGNQG